MRMSHKGRNGVGKKHERHKKKYLFYAPIVTEHDEIENQRRSRGDREKLTNSKELCRRADADKFTNNQATVGDQDHSDRKDRPTDAKAFTNEIQQPTACYSSKSRTHFLNDAERDSDE
ncbi:MAG: hypothetical protein Udaeo_03880 [Candidatus Udaeobacter sp.]|nr:MAG: hypothetical protein Udaeo_03880 [Candidatus Udaeobacter sp.]